MELLVVVSIIGLLVSIAIPNYMNAITRAREAVLKENLYIMRNTLNQYYADKGEYPDSLQTLVRDHYLRAVPVDPFTESSNTWQEIIADSEFLSPSQTPGVWDVKSGSAELSLNGTMYRDW